MQRGVFELTKILWAAIAICVGLTLSFDIKASRVALSAQAHAQTFTTCQANPPFVGPCVGPDGWTQFIPSTTDQNGNPATGTCNKLETGTYTGSCVFYVSSSGSDSNNCFSTPPVQQNFASPCLTPSTVAGYMRTGFPDWLVTQKGSSFFSATPATVTVGFSQPNKKGRSCTEPMVFSTYGTGARPLFNIANNDTKPSLWNTSGGSTNGSFTAITGYEVYGFQRDTTQPGNFSNTSLGSLIGLINTNTSINCLWVENNKMTYGFNMINIQQSSSSNAFNSNVRIRRNVIGHGWGSTGAPNCIFIAQTNAPFLEENFFDTCGWDQIASALNTLSYVAGSNTTFTWGSSPFYLGWSVALGSGTNAAIQCLNTADGITKNTSLYIVNLNVGASTFQLSTNSSGTPLLNMSGSTGNSCYMPQAARESQAHSAYEHDNQPQSTLIPGVMARNIITWDSAGPQWRTGNQVIDNFQAYSGVGFQYISPVGGDPASQVSWNVTTKMIAGSVKNSELTGLVGEGPSTVANGDPQVAISGSATAGDVLNVTFACPTFDATACPLATPAVAQWTVTTSETLPNMATQLISQINALTALTAFTGATPAISVSCPNGCGAFEIANFGPLMGGMTLTAFVTPIGGAATETMNVAIGANNLLPMNISNNLTFSYDSTDSTQNPEAGINLIGSTYGATVANNTGCNWNLLPYQDQSIMTVTAVSSHAGDGSVELTVGGTQPFNTIGQGPVSISGASYIGTGAGYTWAKVVDSTHIYLPNVSYAGTISGTPTVQIYPVTPNVLSGNRFESSGSPNCSGISNPPAANAANITMGAYMQQIGLGATCAVANSCVDQDLINAWYGQSKDTWNPLLRTCVMNDIGFRSPFNATLHNGCPTFSELIPANDNSSLLMTG